MFCLHSFLHQLRKKITQLKLDILIVHVSTFCMTVKNVTVKNE